MTVSDNAIIAKVLSNFFKNLLKKNEYVKKDGKKRIKDPTKSS